MSYFDILGWIGGHPTQVLLWALMLFAGAVVLSIPFVLWQVWCDHEIEKAKNAALKQQVLEAASQLPPPWGSPAAKGFQGRNGRLQ